jgi:hypothetical protein
VLIQKCVEIRLSVEGFEIFECPSALVNYVGFAKAVVQLKESKTGGIDIGERCSELNMVARDKGSP